MQPIAHRAEQRRDVHAQLAEYEFTRAEVPRYTDGIDCYDDYLEMLYRNAQRMAAIDGYPDYDPSDYWTDDDYYERLELMVINAFLGE